MSWNGAGNAVDKQGRAGETARSRTWGTRQTEAGGLRDAQPSRRRRIGLWAALLIAAVVGGVWLWNSLGRGETAAREEMPSVGRPSALRAHDPSARSIEPPSTEDEASAHGGERASPQPKTYRDGRGVLRYEGGLRVPGQRPLAKPIDLGAHRPKIFRHAAEEHISWLLQMRIGEPVVGDYAYGDRFRESFRESLGEPVEILETDDAATRELKSAVQETKEELRRRMENGEDVAKVMNDAMDEFRRLGRYRHELQAQLSRIRQDSGRYSDQDVEDFTKAANEMLKREGLPPLGASRIVMRGLRNR